MREPCYKCKFEHKPIDREPCEHCSDEYIKSGDHPAFQWAKRPTNYERLIRKTPEEMAEFIGGDPMHDICPNNCQDDLDRPCKVCVLDWLKQEADT